MITKTPAKKLNIFIFYFVQIGLLLSLTGAALAIPTVNSIGVWMIAIAILFISSHEIFKGKKIPLHLIFLTILITGIALISMLYSGQFTYKNIINLLSFLQIPLIIAFTKPIDSDKRIKTACFFACLSSILYIYCYYSDRAYAFQTEYGIRIIDDLTLGFSNPNETGMHLVATIFVLCAAFFFVKKKVYRVVLLILLAIVSFFVVKTISRASILILLLLGILLISLIKRNKQIPKTIQKLCFIAPFISFLIVIFFSSFLESHTLFGETMDTGRVSIILSRFESIDAFEWFIGDYSFSFQNSLNAYLSVFLTVGLISMCAFLIIIYYGIKTCNDNAITKYNKVAFLGVLLFLVHASVESANLISGSFYAASFYSIYVMAIDNGELGKSVNLKNTEIRESTT